MPQTTGEDDEDVPQTLEAVPDPRDTLQELDDAVADMMADMNTLRGEVAQRYLPELILMRERVSNPDVPSPVSTCLDFKLSLDDTCLHHVLVSFELNVAVAMQAQAQMQACATGNPAAGDQMSQVLPPATQQTVQQQMQLPCSGPPGVPPLQRPQLSSASLPAVVQHQGPQLGAAQRGPLQQHVPAVLLPSLPLQPSVQPRTPASALQPLQALALLQAVRAQPVAPMSLGQQPASASQGAALQFVPPLLQQGAVQQQQQPGPLAAGLHQVLTSTAREASAVAGQQLRRVGVGQPILGATGEPPRTLHVSSSIAAGSSPFPSCPMSPLTSSLMGLTQSQLQIGCEVSSAAPTSTPAKAVSSIQERSSIASGSYEFRAALPSANSLPPATSAAMPPVTTASAQAPAAVSIAELTGGTGLSPAMLQHMFGRGAPTMQLLPSAVAAPPPAPLTVAVQGGGPSPSAGVHGAAGGGSTQSTVAPTNMGSLR